MSTRRKQSTFVRNRLDRTLQSWQKRMCFYLFEQISQLGSAFRFLVLVTGHPNAAVSRFDAGHVVVRPAFSGHLPLLCRFVNSGSGD